VERGLIFVRDDLDALSSSSRINGHSAVVIRPQLIGVIVVEHVHAVAGGLASTQSE
jgi:hypothetical protein